MSNHHQPQDMWRVRVRDAGASAAEMEISGKISLGEHWVFVLDPASPGTILFATPRQNVVCVVNAKADIEEYEG